MEMGIKKATMNEQTKFQYIVDNHICMYVHMYAHVDISVPLGSKDLTYQRTKSSMLIKLVRTVLVCYISPRWTENTWLQIEREQFRLFGQSPTDCLLAIHPLTPKRFISFTPVRLFSKTSVARVRHPLWKFNEIYKQNFNFPSLSGGEDFIICIVLREKRPTFVSNERNVTKFH